MEEDMGFKAKTTSTLENMSRMFGELCTEVGSTMLAMETDLVDLYSDFVEEVIPLIFSHPNNDVHLSSQQESNTECHENLPSEVLINDESLVDMPLTQTDEFFPVVSDYGNSEEDSSEGEAEEDNEDSSKGEVEGEYSSEEEEDISEGEVKGKAISEEKNEEDNIEGEVEYSSEREADEEEDEDCSKGEVEREYSSEVEEDNSEVEVKGMSMSEEDNEEDSSEGEVEGKGEYSSEEDEEEDSSEGEIEEVGESSSEDEEREEEDCSEHKYSSEGESDERIAPNQVCHAWEAEGEEEYSSEGEAEEEEDSREREPFSRSHGKANIAPNQVCDAYRMLWQEMWETEDEEEYSGEGEAEVDEKYINEGETDKEEEEEEEDSSEGEAEAEEDSSEWESEEDCSEEGDSTEGESEGDYSEEREVQSFEKDLVGELCLVTDCKKQVFNFHEESAPNQETKMQTVQTTLYDLFSGYDEQREEETDENNSCVADFSIDARFDGEYVKFDALSSQATYGRSVDSSEGEEHEDDCASDLDIEELIKAFKEKLEDDCASDLNIEELIQEFEKELNECFNDQETTEVLNNQFQSTRAAFYDFYSGYSGCVEELIPMILTNPIDHVTLDFSSIHENFPYEATIDELLVSIPLEQRYDTNLVPQATTDELVVNLPMQQSSDLVEKKNLSPETPKSNEEDDSDQFPLPNSVVKRHEELIPCGGEHSVMTLPMTVSMHFDGESGESGDSYSCANHDDSSVGDAEDDCLAEETYEKEVDDCSVIQDLEDKELVPKIAACKEYGTETLVVINAEEDDYNEVRKQEHGSYIPVDQEEMPDSDWEILNAEEEEGDYNEVIKEEKVRWLTRFGRLFR